MTNPNDPAINDLDYMSTAGHVHDQTYKNLTKREYFAAMAMQGILTNSQTAHYFSDDRTGGKTVVVAALYIADALIAGLNREPEKKA